MTLGRIGGPMLKENLVRQGVDIAFETDLVYLDVNNMRVGINQAVPTADLDVDGTTKLANIQISTNTIASSDTNGNINLAPNGTGNILINTAAANQVAYIGPNKELLTSSAFTFDGTTVGITTANLTTLVAGNIEISGDTITNLVTNSNINLDPNGTGNVIIDTATAGRIFYSGTSKELLTDANLTFDGSSLALTGVANIDNIKIDGNTISSRDTDGNVNLTPDGTGKVAITYLTATRVPYASTNGALIDSANLTFDGTDLYVSGLSVSGSGSGISLGNISIAGNTISSINTNGNIYLDPNGTGQIVAQGTNALTVPAGTTGERPAGTAGDVRVNTTTGNFEYYNGSAWIEITPINPLVGDEFNGDGSTVNFTLSQSGTSDGTLVSINGVVQRPGQSYSVSGTTLTFVEAPLAGGVIDVRLLSTAVSFSILSDENTSVSVNDTTETVTSTVNGNVIMTVSNSAILPGANITYDLGSSSLRFDEIFGNVFTGTGSIASITNSAPASSSATGVKGQVSYNGNYLYICVAANTWIRLDTTTSF